MADAIGADVSKVRRLEDADVLHPVMVHGVRRFDPAEVEAYTRRTGETTGGLAADAFALFEEKTPLHKVVIETRARPEQIEELFATYLRLREASRNVLSVPKAYVERMLRLAEAVGVPVRATAATSTRELLAWLSDTMREVFTARDGRFTDWPDDGWWERDRAVDEVAPAVPELVVSAQAGTAARG